MTDKPQETYEAVFEASWHAITQGDADIDACLRAYPDHAPMLQRDLMLAQALGRMPSAPPMASARVDALEARLLAHFNAAPITHPAPVVRPHPQFWLRRMVASILVAIVIAFSGTGATVVASADSMPDETLYVVKRWWESVVLLIGQWLGNLDDIWLQLAQTRLEEWLYMADKLDASDPTLQGLLMDLGQALQQARTTAEDDASLRALVAFTISTQRIINDVQPLGDEDSLMVLFDAIITPAPQPDQPMTITPTSPPTSTVSPTLTLTWTATATDEIAADIATETPRTTSTPRFAPTATTTPTPSPSPTLLLQATATHTPSPTWTPLPPLPSITPLRGQGSLNGAPPLAPSATPYNPASSDSPFFVRQTQQAVRMTQTAEAQATEDVTAP